MNQFRKIETPLPDVFVLERFRHEDARGPFTKTFNAGMLADLGLGDGSGFAESICSTSTKGVIRGMHYQRPPYAHDKIVSVVQGEILDVVVGVRPDNKGQVFGEVLTDKNARTLFIPAGYAHGFLVLSESATVVYHTDKGHHQASEAGVIYSSIDFNWPVNSPKLSVKDSQLTSISHAEW